MKGSHALRWQDPEALARPPGLLALVRHTHVCPEKACRVRFLRCTAPSCAGQRFLRCVACKLDRIEQRHRSIAAAQSN